MRKPIVTILSLLTMIAAGTAAKAQPALKLVTVDIARTYEQYYKVKDNEDKLRVTQQKAQEQVEDLQKQLEAVVDEYKALEEKTKSTALSKEGLEKAKADAQSKLEEVNAKQQEGQQFVQNTQRSLQLRQKNLRDLMLDEINKVVLEVREKHGATVVLDTSGPSGIGVPSVIYADPAYDVTEEVITELNKSKPVEAPAPAAAAAPAGSSN